MMEEEFFGHWEIMKPLMLAKWNRLKAKDLEGVQPVLSDLVEVVHKKYKDMPRQSIIEDLKNLGDQIKI